MTESHEESPPVERQFHSYVTHHIPWYVRAMWIAFWIGMIWYIVKWAIPNAKNYF